MAAGERISSFGFPFFLCLLQGIFGQRTFQVYQPPGPEPCSSQCCQPTCKTIFSAKCGSCCKDYINDAKDCNSCLSDAGCASLPTPAPPAPPTPAPPTPAPPTPAPPTPAPATPAPPTPAPSGGGTVYIIRHGEKELSNPLFGCLSDQGHARARHLVNVFNDVVLPKPKYIFAHWYDDPLDCERCNQTVTPIAEALDLKIDLTHGGGWPGRGPNGGNHGAAVAIIQALEATGGPVLVGWEHVNIQTLAADLGVSKKAIPVWPSAEFDRIYKLQFDEHAMLTSFSINQENFTHADLDTIVV